MTHTCHLDPEATCWTCAAEEIHHDRGIRLTPQQAELDHISRRDLSFGERAALAANAVARHRYEARRAS